MTIDPSHPSNVGAEHVGLSPIKQYMLAPCAKRREVLAIWDEGQEGDTLDDSSSASLSHPSELISRLLRALLFILELPCCLDFEVIAVIWECVLRCAHETFSKFNMSVRFAAIRPSGLHAGEPLGVLPLPWHQSFEFDDKEGGV